MPRPEPRQPDPMPADKRAELCRAQRLERITLAARLTVLATLYTALGHSETLNAIWLKSLWALLPPVAFLLACRLERRQPNQRFPYGFYRAPSIAFLSSALALSCMGAYLIYNGIHALLQARQPSLETFAAGGSLIHWDGWLDVLALAYSTVVPFLFGNQRQRLALALHDKGLYADASMSRANWLAGSAAIIGVLGIGMGLWWADFVATLVIGGNILYHGYRHLKTAACDLIDEVPRKLGTSTIDPLGTEIRRYLESLDWIDDARVRLREEGRLITGVGFVCANTEADLVARLDDARTHIVQMDWRLLNFGLIPVTADNCTVQAGAQA